MRSFLTPPRRTASGYPLATARDKATREAYKLAYDLLGSTLKGITGFVINTLIDAFMLQLDSFYDLLNQGNFQQKVEEFYEGLRGIVQRISSYTWGPIESTNAGLMVNIWGTEDPLAKIGVSGYRTNIGGYNLVDEFHPLFNIEIEGADHFDYVYGVRDFEKDFPDQIERQKAIDKNKKVSNFVTRLILNARSAESLEAFLSREAALLNAHFDSVRNLWGIAVL